MIEEGEAHALCMLYLRCVCAHRNVLCIVSSPVKYMVCVRSLSLNMVCVCVRALPLSKYGVCVCACVCYLPLASLNIVCACARVLSLSSLSSLSKYGVCVCARSLSLNIVCVLSSSSTNSEHEREGRAHQAHS